MADQNSAATVKINGQKVELNLERILQRINEDIRNNNAPTTSSVSNNNNRPSIYEIIKSDKLGPFIKFMKEGNIPGNGINFNFSIGSLQLTPLHLAAFFKSVNILKYLLRLPQVFPNYPNKEMDTPLNLGLLNSENDASAVHLIQIFQQHQDLNIFRRNQENVFPLLITIQKKFHQGSKLLLSFKKDIIDQYEAQDLLRALQLALCTKQNDLADFMNQNIGPTRKLQILQEIDSNSKATAASDLLAECALLLRQTVSNSASIQNEKTDDESDDGSEDDSMVTLVTKQKPAQTQKEDQMTVVRPKPVPDRNYFLTVDDAGDRPLKTGDIIKTLSAFNVKKGLPTSAKESHAEKLADKFGTIHEIIGNKVYLEINSADLQCITILKAEATVFSSEGISMVLGDSSVGRIGSFVEVVQSDTKQVQKLVETPGYVRGMEDAYGRTGRIVRIFRNTDLLIQFAWGSRFYFKPETVQKSSSDKITTQDCNNKWIAIGSLVQVKKPLAEFIKLQKKNHLPHEGTYTALPLKFAEVKEIQIKAFSTSKPLKIIYNSSPYFVSVESVELIDWIKDRSGKELRVGDQVQVINDKEELKSLHIQIEGPEMLEVSGQLGFIVEFCQNEASEAHSVLAKVEFDGATAFYFDLRAIEVYSGTIVPISSHKQTLKNASADAGGSEKLSEIDRNTIKLGYFLGKGGMGYIREGVWNRNGTLINVAVKQIQDNLASKPEHVANFMKEAEIQFSLRHPNIISLLGVSSKQEGEVKDLWIVMDLVNGTDLYDLLFSSSDTVNILSFDKKIRLCMDMCNAVAFMHQKGYMHSDIKPHNMMIDSTGKLYVCDFGITKFLGNMDVMSFATQYTNNLYGTMYYIPPECVQIDEKTGLHRKAKFPGDIWALGAVFYEIFTQSHLCDNHVQFLTDKSSGNDRLVKQKVAQLEVTIRGIVGRALDFDRHARPSAQELCEFFYELVNQPHV